MHYKNTNFCIKNAEFFQLKNRHFFEFFLTKNVLAKNVRKHLKFRIFFTKIAIEIAILSQEYSKIYRNFVAILRYNYRKNNLKNF